ncbi:hypothetical protein [Parvularcula sp. IMCC14364]|uniref:hypothetical protein n=1 Tax=Parvularcula sp. IMCC14364 TaxID=3067902 RepID=UPI0027427815|nr:hypothetical protein [Parvularcula sp. IMCC14364]
MKKLIASGLLFVLAAACTAEKSGSDMSEKATGVAQPGGSAADGAENTLGLDDNAAIDANDSLSPAARANRPDYAAILAAEDRPQADRQLDALRKPLEVMEFIGLQRGWTVLELEAGDGYYTELFSRAVRPAGAVYMHNPEEFDNFLGDAVTNRLAGNRLPNVRVLKSDFDEVPISSETAQIITWILGPHELWFQPDNKPEGFGDPLETFTRVKEMLTPNGQLIILDHAAAPGTPEISGGTTHRIDPAVIIALAEQAGLGVYKQSDVLRNPEDDYTKPVFDPEVRRKTDRFLISFKRKERLSE